MINPTCACGRRGAIEVKPLQGFLSCISTPNRETLASEAKLPNPHSALKAHCQFLIMKRSGVCVGHLRRPLHSLHVLHGARITRFVFTEPRRRRRTSIAPRPPTAHVGLWRVECILNVEDVPSP